MLRTALFALVAATAALSASAQDANRTVTIGEKFSVRFELLNEDRPYWVYLPASYETGGGLQQRYPVLYLLDGDINFHSATGVVQFMGNGPNGNSQIPELIVVAISNTNRTRDLTPTHSTIS